MQDKYKLSQFFIDGARLSDPIKTDAIQRVAKAFRANAMRQSYASSMFNLLVQGGIRMGLAQTAAEIQFTGKLFPDSSEIGGHHGDIEQRRRDLLNGTIDPPYKTSAWVADLLLEGFDEHSTGPQIRVILEAAVIGSWTTFEVLASDLWVAVVNRFPLLGVRALDADPDPSDKAEEQERKAKKPVSVAAQLTLRPDFDLRRSMGDVLADAFPMISWGKILHAYNKTFREKSIADVFRDSGLRSLSAVRNALVHNAGKADKDFTQQVSGDDRFRHLKPDDDIPLDGAVVSQLAASAIRQGVTLIRVVDEWCAITDLTGGSVK
jgi:hypothetical protein